LLRKGKINMIQASCPGDIKYAGVCPCRIMTAGDWPSRKQQVRFCLL